MSRTRRQLVAGLTALTLLGAAACSEGAVEPAATTGQNQGAGHDTGPDGADPGDGDGTTSTDPGDGAPRTSGRGEAGGSATGPSPTTGSTTAPGNGTATGTQAPADPGGLPGAAELEQARAEVAELSDEQLVGQLVVASYGGTDAAGAADLVRRHHLAGVITLGDNVPTAPDQRVPRLTELTAAVQDAVAEDGRDWPAFTGIDQEGGPITRVGAPLDRWPAAMSLGAADDPELTQEVTRASGEQLRALGYTVVFAPSADLTSGPEDPTIGARSPGSDPDRVTRTAVAGTAGFLEAGILPVVKHFPGHGAVTEDSHLGAAILPVDWDTLQERELVPFRAVVDAGAPAVMPGHVVVEAIDPDLPATLSQAVLTDLLREDLGFEGLVVTDAMNMGAITQAGTAGHPAVAALEAGVDVLLMPPDPGGTIDAVLAALADGTLTRDDLEESAARVVATLRHQEHVPAPDEDVIGSAHDLSVRAAGAGLTQLSGTCGERLVGDSISISGGTEQDRAALTAAAQEAGLDTGGGDTVVLVGGTSYQAGGGPGGPGTGSGDIVVTTDRPYPLADSEASTALIAAYGRDAATMEALVQVLLGEQTATGTLPTPVGEYPIGSGCD